MPTAYAGTVFAIGDSVMLGAKPCMEDLGFTVDAVESRSFWDGEKDILAAVADDTLTDRVVVHLGTNGPFAASDFDSLMEAVGDRDVYWMTIHTRDTPAYEFRNDLNDLIRAQVARWPNAHLIDYAAIGAALTEEERAHWYWNDGTHLRPGGCREFAAMIDDAVRQPA